MAIQRIGDIDFSLLAGVEPVEGWDERDRRVRAERAAVESAEKRRIEHQRRSALVRFGVPTKDVERICVDGLQDTEPLRLVRESKKLITVLCGGVGCGKTTAAAWWLSEPPEKHPYLDTGDPLFLSVSRMERLSRYDGQQMERVERASKLVIDDLGREYHDAKGNFLALFLGIVNSRYDDQLPLLITTNLSVKGFADRYGERTLDRLREAGQVYETSAPSLRGRR